MESVTELLVVLLGALTSIIMALLKKFSGFLGKAPGPIQALVVVALSFPVAWLAGFFGMELPADPFTWDGALINAMLVSLTSMGAHAVGKTVGPGE